LENDGDEGSAGSHFERTFFFNEFMTPSAIDNEVASGFSFNLLKDTGWYGVEDHFFENFHAGKNMGCSWFEACHNAKNKPFFCDKGDKYGCTFDYLSVG